MNQTIFEKRPPEHLKHERVYQARQWDSKLRKSDYSNKAYHKSTNCNSVTSINERQNNLNDKKICFNCTGTKSVTNNECKTEST